MRKLFLVLASTAPAVLFAFNPPANHTNSVIRNGVTYAQRGGMSTSTYVVTNVDVDAMLIPLVSVTNREGSAVTAKDVGAVPTNITEEVRISLSEMMNVFPNGTTNGIRLSVNGREIDVRIDTNANVIVFGDRSLSDYGITDALKDDETSLTNSSAFRGAVEKVSPPVELPQKWALANVTNSGGTAVRAADVGARSDTWLPTAAQIEAVQVNNGMASGLTAWNVSLRGDVHLYYQTNFYESKMYVDAGSLMYLSSWNQLRLLGGQTLPQYVAVEAVATNLWNAGHNAYQTADGGYYEKRGGTYWINALDPIPAKNLYKVDGAENTWQTNPGSPSMNKVVYEEPFWIIYSDLGSGWEYMEIVADSLDTSAIRGMMRSFTRATLPDTWEKTKQVAYTNDIPTALRNPFSVTFSGSADATYDGSAAKTVVIPSTNGLASASDATNAAKSVVGAYSPLRYDCGLNVTWTNVVHNGHVYYVTVTNANVATP